MKISQKINYFSKAELGLWSGSVILILTAFLFFDRENYMTLSASLIGVTSLIFAAKGNPVAQVLMVIFSLLYGIISYTFSYYGEMITYIGMTLPMAVVSLISWVKNPYSKSEVRIEQLKRNDFIIMLLLSAVVTFIFYFILDFFDTANIIPSTISVTTSFAAVYLTFRRSPYYALAYALNDIVLIILWSMASLKDITYISVTVCFAAFLVNDIYGFLNWKTMEKRQLDGIKS